MATAGSLHAGWSGAGADSSTDAVRFLTSDQGTDEAMRERLRVPKAASVAPGPPDPRRLPTKVEKFDLRPAVKRNYPAGGEHEITPPVPAQQS